MDPASTPYRVHQCSKCPRNTEYYCVSCPCDMCPQCKENHLKDLKTIDHNVLSFLDKVNYIPTQEYCGTHPSEVLRKYCEICELPVCYLCRRHRNHKKIYVVESYKAMLQKHRETIYTIKSEALFYRPVLLKGIKADVKTCHTEFFPHQSEMTAKAKNLKDLIDKVQKDFMNNVFCDFDFKHRCIKQKIEMSRHIVRLQRYEDRCVQTAFSFSALQFLSSIKTPLPQKHLILHTSQLSMTESLNKEDVIESLSAIKITERGNRRVGNQCLLKLMSAAEFHHFRSVKGVDRCLHISCVSSNRVWVSDYYNLIMTDTTGVPLYRVEDSCIGYRGLHTVNSESELIYIDRKHNINKLSKDMKTTTTFVERTDSTWGPRCIYWSPSTGDLLVGMYYIHRYIVTGKVTRYNQIGQLIHTIQHNDIGRRLYSVPLYITENSNGDVLVSDSGAVVVTERGGRHRFSYTGYPLGSGLWPHGICTDALSHILVCDVTTNTVQMLDKDGQFLSHLLIEPREIGEPCGLSYDVNTHRLWVGSWDDNKVCVYRYITRQDAPTDDDTRRPDGEPCPSKHQS